MDNEMIERCAISIKEAQWGKRIAWEACDESFKVMKRQQAISAIKATRNPTEKMIIQNKMSQQDVEKYQRVIDTILSDETYGSNFNPIIEANL